VQSCIARTIQILYQLHGGILPDTAPDADESHLDGSEAAANHTVQPADIYSEDSGQPDHCQGEAIEPGKEPDEPDVNSDIDLGSTNAAVGTDPGTSDP